MATAPRTGYPKSVKGTQFVITVEKDGVWLYGNRQTFQTLAKWMNWIAQSNPSEHNELHTIWHMHDTAKMTVLFDEKTRSVFKRPAILKKRLKKAGEDVGFELTFMVGEPKDLKKLLKLRRIPKGFRSRICYAC